MEHTKNLNKIVLKIELFGDTNLRLTLVYLDNRFQSIPNGRFLYFKSKVTNFYIYSRKTLAITPISLRLPTKSNYKSSSIIKNFANDTLRKEWLSRLYKGLLEWGNECDIFKNDKSKVTCNFNGDYWIL